MAKDMALILMGAMMVLAYQRYSEPMMDMVDEACCKAKIKANEMM